MAMKGQAYPQTVKKPVAAFMAGLTASMARPADLGKTIAKVYR
jgi:hypothetical protein